MYGSKSMAQILLEIQQNRPEVFFTYFQSNHEGDLIDQIHAFEGDGIVLNAGGYAHTSVALRDAVEYIQEQSIPVVNVHISDIHAREPFRDIDLLSDVCAHTIIGHGTNGYEEAIEYIIATAN